MPTLLVGHVTKDGSVAGPRTLEHLVDVVCQFEGDRHSRLRLVRASKNRYGPTDEVGCFDLTERRDRRARRTRAGSSSPRPCRPCPGTCVTVTLEGRRPLAAEIQALVAPTTLSNPRRTTSGHRLEPTGDGAGRAAAARRGRASPTGTSTCRRSAAREWSSPPPTSRSRSPSLGARTTALPTGHLVAFGEVGLAGEIRPVLGLSRRLTEAGRLGFLKAVVPP